MATSVDYLIKVLADTKDADSKLSNFGKKAGLVGGVLGAAGLAAAGGLFVIGSTFDEVTDTIRTGTGATGDALDGLVDSAKNVGKEVPASFDQIGTTVADLNTRLGLSGDTLETVASQYLEAGRILGEDVDIQSTSAAFSAFKIEGDAVAGAMDSLFQVSQATGVGMNELAAGVQSNAPALQLLGMGFEDSIALLGSLDKAGLNSEQVLKSLGKGLVTLAQDGEQPADAYRRVVGEIQGFIEAGDEAAALDLAGQVFGTRGATQFIGALQSGVLNMDDLMAATGATGDTILGVADETKDFGERWTEMVNTVMVALEPLATAVFTAVGDGLAYVMPYVEQFGAWISENTWAIGAIATVIGVTLVAAVIAWTASIWAMNAALFASPITWIILAIVALIAVIVLLVLNWDTVVAWITDVWSGFVSWITEVTNGFVGWWNGVWEGFATWITGVWEGFIGWIQGLFTGFVGWLMSTGSQISNWWNNFWSAIGAFVQNAWQSMIVAPIQNAVTWMWNAINTGLNWIRDAWNGMWSGLGGIVRGVFNGVLGSIEGGVNGAIGLINGLINSVNSVAGVVGIQIGTIPKVNLPRLAQGGVTTGPTIALIGDNPGGQEVVEPVNAFAARLERVALAAAEGRGGGGEVNVYVTNKAGVALEDLIDIHIERAGRRQKVQLTDGRRTRR